MFAKIAVLLVACLVQVNCEWSYCECMANVRGTKVKYDAGLKAYFGKILKTQAHVLHKFSSEFAAMANKQTCTDYYYKQDPKDALDTLDALILCGGYPLKDHYFAKWSTMTNDVNICTYISINGPQASSLIKSNLAAVEACNIDDVIRGFMFKEFQQCKSESGCP